MNVVICIAVAGTCCSTRSQSPASSWSQLCVTSNRPTPSLEVRNSTTTWNCCHINIKSYRTSELFCDLKKKKKNHTKEQHRLFSEVSIMKSVCVCVCMCVCVCVCVCVLLTGKRPFGVSLLYMGWDKHYGFQLYQSDPSGNYGGWKATCIGNNSAVRLTGVTESAPQCIT